MSNEFDLERAKAGEPIEYFISTDNWIAAHFVGIATSGEPVIQIREGFSEGVPSFQGPVTRIKSMLRMAPQKAKVRYRDYVLKVRDRHLVVSLNEDAAVTTEEVEQRQDFIRWIHRDWQEVEITE